MARMVWKTTSTGIKAQFIADVMKESLFNYAFDSNKTPSLSLHFFCNDYLETSKLVEKGIMKEGNMIPLVEEFEYIINHSPWLPLDIDNVLFQFKNKQGFYRDVSQDKNTESSARAVHYKENANYISKTLIAKTPYTELIINRIKTILNSSTFTLEEKRDLYYCVREFLSELINLGVNKSHLYNQVQNKLFSKRNSDDDIAYIVNFMRGLCPAPSEYTVVFGISEDSYNEMKEIIRGVRPADDNEIRRLGYSYVAEAHFEGYDPISALLNAKRSLSIVFSIYNSCIHNANITLQDRGLVKGKEEEFHLINDKTNLLSKNKNKPKQERINTLKVAAKTGLSGSLVSAFELHNHALKTDEPQTQLLNLWTIFELLIETKQDQMNRVNYVANVLCSILCSIYWERLLTTLYNQISLTKSVRNLIQTEPRGKNDIEKLAFILKDNSSIQAQMITDLSDYPLEVYRIELYANIFSSRKNMKEYLERHADRLRWQIMRIYRNRCMVVHNGSHFDYLDNIVENLHYYVDEMFDYVFSRIQNGVTDMQAILAHARLIDASKQQILNKKDVTMVDDEYLEIIFKH